MTSSVRRTEGPALTDAAITEAATAVREFEKAGISPPERLVAIAGRALTAAGPSTATRAARRARH